MEEIEKDGTQDYIFENPSSDSKNKLLKELTRMKVLKQSLTALNLTGNLTKFQ